MLQSGIRALAQLVVLLALLGSARAEAHLSVPPFAAPPELAIFGPEVALAVAAGLERAGFEIAPGGVSVSGRLESLDPDRVRLRASLLGRAAQVEGPLERVDQLAADLSERLVALAPASARRSPARPARLEAAAGDAAARPAAASPPPAAALAALASRDAGAARRPTRPPAAPPAGDLPGPSAPATDTTSPEPAAPPSTTTRETPVAEPPAPAEPGRDPAPEPSTSGSPAPPVDPPPAPEAPRPPPGGPPAAEPSPATIAPPVYPPSARPDYPPVRPVLRPRGAFRGFSPGFRMLGGAVLHTVRTPDGCPAGEWATFAARDVLERDLLVRTVRGGCGVASLEAALAEAARAGVNAVIMPSLEALRFEAQGAGLQPSGRLRVVAVRDGRVVLDRRLEVVSHTLARPDVPRATYDLVARGFAELAGDLGAALMAR